MYTHMHTCTHTHTHTHTHRVVDQLLGSEVRFLPNSVSFLPFVGDTRLMALEEYKDARP